MSGKTARRLRKKNFPPKKLMALCAGLCVSYAPVVADSEFLVTVFGTATKPFGQAHEMQYGIGGGLKATYRPVKFINIFAQGEYLSMALPGTSPVSVLDASLGAGYHLKATDRIGVDFNVSGGYYNARAGKSMSGFTAGASIVFSYKISPIISLDTGVSATHYASGSSPLMLVNAAVSPGVTFNISEMFNRNAKVNMELSDLAPVFPALYSWYDNNSFGKAVITNNEETAITDVTISFYQPQYMAHAKECATIRKIEKGESVEVDLIAFFNEQMLELTEMTDTNSAIIVNYMRLGQKKTKTFQLDVPVYGRNNMSWDDDRRAAVFVSSRDPAAMHFAKYVTSIVREKRRADIPLNIQYAMGIFEALDEFGINYVVDPSSAFADNVGTASIDFLQFPYQTLMYKGGDCDDLSILVCSLFEAVGIRTAFITIPGHIFMAFDSGMNVEQAKENLRYFDNYIDVEGEVWIPLEITLSDEGFFKAYRYGAREWNKAFADGTAQIYRMQDSWKIYPPISVPGAAVKFTMPESKQISVAFEQSVDQWSYVEWQDELLFKTARLAVETEEQKENENVLKEDPLAPETLYEVLSMSGQAVAMLTTSGIKERRNDEEDEDDEPGTEPEPDSNDEYVEPLIAVNVPGLESLGIKVSKSSTNFVSKFEERQRELEPVTKTEPAPVKKEITPAVVKTETAVAPEPIVTETGMQVILADTEGTSSAKTEKAVVQTTQSETNKPDVIEYKTETSASEQKSVSSNPEVIKSETETAEVKENTAETSQSEESKVIEMTPSKPETNTPAKPEVIKAKYENDEKSEEPVAESTSAEKSHLHSTASASVIGLTGVVLAASTGVYINKKKKRRRGR